LKAECANQGGLRRKIENIAGKTQKMENNKFFVTEGKTKKT